MWVDCDCGSEKVSKRKKKEERRKKEVDSSLSFHYF
jgi:hypothetical protein